jgi:hypothetical protein
MGLDKDVFEVENWVCREFSLRCDVVYKRSIGSPQSMGQQMKEESSGLWMNSIVC